MIKAVIFDMDGVLIDAREWHYEALNRALRLFGQEISRIDHLSTFDGLPTSRKLEMLSESQQLPRELHTFVNELKQIYTIEMVNTRCKPYFPHEYLLSMLKRRGVRLAVASNSVRNSVDMMMQRSHLDKYLDLTLSNEDVLRAKPDPEIYNLAIKMLGVRAAETVIVEDNEHGLRAARASGAFVMAVRNVEDVHFDAVRAFVRTVGEELP